MFKITFLPISLHDTCCLSWGGDPHNTETVGNSHLCPTYETFHARAALYGEWGRLKGLSQAESAACLKEGASQ